MGVIGSKIMVAPQGIAARVPARIWAAGFKEPGEDQAPPLPVLMWPLAMG